MEGEVKEIVDTETYSCTMPVKVAFEKDNDGKAVKFVVHLTDAEVESI